MNHCHCPGCRKGALNATSLVLPLDALRFVCGTELVTTFEIAGEIYTAHAFCSVCGSSLPRFDVGRAIAIVPMGSFEQEVDAPADSHAEIDADAPTLPGCPAFADQGATH